MEVNRKRRGVSIKRRWFVFSTGGGQERKSHSMKVERCIGWVGGLFQPVCLQCKHRRSHDGLLYRPVRGAHGVRESLSHSLRLIWFLTFLLQSHSNDYKDSKWLQRDAKWVQGDTNQHEMTAEKKGETNKRQQRKKRSTKQHNVSKDKRKITTKWD